MRPSCAVFSKRMGEESLFIDTCPDGVVDVVLDMCGLGLHRGSGKELIHPQYCSARMGVSSR